MDRRLGPLKPGDDFLKYQIKRLIGRGGHAYVYEAHDDFLNLDFAIKVIPSSHDTGQDLAARARAEARVLVRIAHDNVVKVMDAGATNDGLVYLIMELLVGRDLRKALHQHQRLTVVEALHAAAQTAAGVAAAHRLGAVHRDLKPENIFIEPGEKFKVLDFGVAKVMGYGAPTTQRDLLHGTALYMAPEQLKGEGVTAKSDIFALGTMLYETLYAHPVLLNGRVPNLEELGRAQIQVLPPPLNEVDPTIPTYVARFVQRAIAKKPDQRYATMDELSQAAIDVLSRYVNESRARGYEPQCRELSAGPPSSPAPPPGPSHAPVPPQVAPHQASGDTDAMSRPAFSTAMSGQVVSNEPYKVRTEPHKVLTHTLRMNPGPSSPDAPTAAVESAQFAHFAQSVQSAQSSQSAQSMQSAQAAPADYVDRATRTHHPPGRAVLAAQGTPPPTTSGAADAPRRSSRVSSKVLALTALALGLAIGIGYALWIPAEPSSETATAAATATATATAAMAAAATVTPPPPAQDSPAAPGEASAPVVIVAAPPAAAATPTASTSSPPTAAAARSPATTARSPATATRSPATATPAPATQTRPPSKPKSPQPRHDLSKLPSSGLDD